ncbi:hypothetical protein Vretifemale_16996, partial [Volvox reticuliferus]
MGDGRGGDEGVLAACTGVGDDEGVVLFLVGFVCGGGDCGDGSRDFGRGGDGDSCGVNCLGSGSRGLILVFIGCCPRGVGGEFFFGGDG